MPASTTPRGSVFACKADNEFLTQTCSAWCCGVYSMSEKTRCEYKAARDESEETWMEVDACKGQEIWKNKKKDSCLGFLVLQTDLPFLFVSVLIRGLLCHCCAAADLLPLTAPQPLSQLEAPLVQSCLPPLSLSSLHAESLSLKGRMNLLLCVCLPGSTYVNYLNRKQVD